MSASHQVLDRPLVSIIIVSFNTRAILKECLNRVKAHSGDIDPEIIVVDNASADDSPEMVQTEFPEVILIVSERNLGFAGGNNLGIRKARGRYILLLNSDAYLLPGTLSATISFMEKTSDCGILGVKLIGENGDMQPCARMLPGPWRKLLVISGLADRFSGSKLFGGPDFSWWSHDSPRDVGWVPGAYFLIRRAVVDTIGGMDARYFLYFEETDYCLQAARAGWRVMIFPEVSVIHLGGESSKTAQQPMSDKGKQILQYQFQSEYMYYRKNYGFFRVFAASGVEIFWNMVVIAKNLVIRRRDSSLKITNSKTLIALMLRTLRSGRWGKFER
jgi:GT2 family glycosyltransferase